MRRFTALLLALTLGLTMGLAACCEGGDDDAKVGTTDQSDDSSTTDDDSTTDGDKKDPSVGGDDDKKGPSVGGDEQAYVDALIAEFKADPDDTMPLDDAQVECMAKGFIDVLGVDRLEAAGITPENFDDDEAFDAVPLDEADGKALFAIYGDCDIDIRETMIASMAADDDVTPEQQACFESVLTDEYIERLIVSGMATGGGGDDTDDLGDLEDLELMGPMMACAFLGTDMSDFSGLDESDLGDLSDDGFDD